MGKSSQKRAPERSRPAAGHLLLAAVCLSATGFAWAVAPGAEDQHQQRNYDARILYNLTWSQTPSAEQQLALEGLRAGVPGLAATFDEDFGTARTLTHPTGYLSGPARGVAALEVALGFVQANHRALGLTGADVAGYEVRDVIFSQLSGATRVVLQQVHGGLAVYNGQLQVNVNRDGRVMSVNNGFVPDLAASVVGIEPAIDVATAVALLAEHLGVASSEQPAVLETRPGVRRRTLLAHRDLSREEIAAHLAWLPVRAGDVRLVWNVQVRTLDDLHHYDATVDAASGRVWTRFDWVASDSFRVYPEPVESPNHTTPLPPADARVLVVDPEDPVASPSDWLTNPSGVMSGNNVHACADANANDVCDSPEPTCSSGVCDFSIDLTSAPSASIPAAIANLFYWNNVIHDITYQYGFDEPSGNFQEDNFGRGGAGSDSVNADAQDGSGNCNANFGTPVDGFNPRMQMFTCTNASPARDGDYDNGVIVHEYGHGISNRLVGGPSNVSCLNNTQQAGEGWSDWYALAYTGEVGDAGTDARGVGSYLFNLPPQGGTIRDLPYSTDPAVNDWTYESISGASVPHGVGSRWAQAAWEVYWALVDEHGFEVDVGDFDISDPGEAGNKRAIFYVTEGLKNTACSPTFVDNRDGIIQAATDNFGGEDVCLLWEAFAAFGLGTDAVSGGSNSTNPTNGFEIPEACQCQPSPSAGAGPDQVICLGDSIVIGTPAQPGNAYSWAPGGETSAQIAVSPAADTVYAVTATTAACGSEQDSATVFVDDGSTPPGLADDFEGDNSDWTATGLWHEVTNSTCASPANGYSSPVTAFYYGQDATCDYDTGGANSGTLTSPAITGIDAGSTLSFDYFRVVESFAGGSYDLTEVDVVTAGGSTTVFALDSTTASTAAWVSSGAISLAAFAGQPIQVRFRFDTVDGFANSFTGWFIDDVTVTGTSHCATGCLADADCDDGLFCNGDETCDAGTGLCLAGAVPVCDDGDSCTGIETCDEVTDSCGPGIIFDTDGDGVDDSCDACPGSDDAPDGDNDGVPDGCDVCPGPLVVPPQDVISTVVYESCDTITVDDGFHILASGDVTLRAAESVGFSSVLSVATGAGLEVEIDPGLAPATGVAGQ